jgi:hypothetical protein
MAENHFVDDDAELDPPLGDLEFESLEEGELVEGITRLSPPLLEIGPGDPLRAAMTLALAAGLTITATTNGTHAPSSYHYSRPYRTVVVKGRRYQVGRAFDAGAPGNPHRLYRQFFLRIAATRAPTELFYDPMGYSYKNGKRVAWTVGGHRDHVHVAY